MKLILALIGIGITLSGCGALVKSDVVIPYPPDEATQKSLLGDVCFDYQDKTGKDKQVCKQKHPDGDPVWAWMSKLENAKDKQELNNVSESGKPD